MMKNKLCTIDSEGHERPKLKYGYSSSVFQLSVSVVLVFFAWFFILPTSVCSYAYILAGNFLVSETHFIVLSNAAGLLGLFLGGFLLAFISDIKKLLLFVLTLLNLFNVLIFVIPPQLGLYFIIAQYLLLGVYVALASYLYFTNTIKYKGYLFTGSILASIIFITSFFKQGTEGVTASSIFTMNLIMSLVVLVFVVILIINRAPQIREKSIHLSNKPVTSVFLLQCVYTIILSIALGYLTNEREFSIAASATLSSVLNAIPYIGAIILVFSLPSRKPHMGVVTYIANALLIITIAYVDFFQYKTAMSASLNVMLYFAIAINQLFIFDTIFVVADKSRFPSHVISIGLMVFVFGSAIGDHLGEMIIIDKFENIDQILITLIALASLILPMLRIMLSNLSKTSIFRINAVSVDRVTPESASDIHSEADHFAAQEPSSIYPQVAHYDTLTNREKEVLDLLTKGYPSEVICSTLFISTNTLKRHVQNIYNKLGVHNRAELFKLLHKK